MTRNFRDKKTSETRGPNSRTISHPKPTALPQAGLTPSELRRIVLDLIG